MALNYSHRPVSQAHISEDNLVSPLRIVNGYLVEGVCEKNGEGYSMPWHLSQVEADEQNFSCGKDRVECCCSSELISQDIVDLLPSDPFGMDIKTTFTAITGWLEDLEVNCGGYMRDNSSGASQDYGLVAGWNLIWNNSLKFEPFACPIQLNEELNMDMQSFPSSVQVNQNLNMGRDYFPSSLECDKKLNATDNIEDTITFSKGSVSRSFEMRSTEIVEDIMDFSNRGDSCSSEMRYTQTVDGLSDFEGAPHEGLNYVLSYLGVKDLLSVERVCSSLSSAVRGDPLFWKKIHIDQPLNERITDDVLVQLASRAQGKLECLSLVECPKVTDDGLRRVLETNQRLTKLCVPGCTRISIECIVNSVRTHNSNNEFGGIKHLRIGGLYGVNHEHFEELNLLLGSGDNKTESYHKPHFYHRGNFYLPYDDDRAIDIEMCPRCEKFRLVYDCPAERCKVEDKSPQVCRACTLCIGRCAQCGRCINDTEFEETFCLELLCSDCFKQLLKCQNKLDKKVDSCGAQHGASYHFSLHG